MKKLLCVGLGLAAATMAPSLARAQDSEQPPVLAISWFQCNWNDVERIMAEADSMRLPIWSELKEEGMISAAGTFTHWQADEWNVAYYYVADDIATYLAAQAEEFRRFAERYPDYDNAAYFDSCPVHKDAFYHLGPRTKDDDDADEE